jgi:hypothetical protein
MSGVDFELEDPEGHPEPVVVLTRLAHRYQRATDRPAAPELAATDGGL